MKLTITTGTEKDFFERGKSLARKLDQQERVEPECFISFEDPQDLIELITKARLAVFEAIKEYPGSIAEVARRLHRDRSTVKRDVDLLAEAGLVRVEERPFHGHGRMKFVSAAAERFRLTAEVGRTSLDPQVWPLTDVRPPGGPLRFCIRVHLCSSVVDLEWVCPRAEKKRASAGGPFYAVTGMRGSRG